MNEEDLFEEYERNFIKEHTTSIKCYTEEAYNKLQQENKQLKENNKSYQEEMARTWKKNDNLKSILTELEEWLKEQDTKYNNPAYHITLDKIQELKEKYK